MAYVSYHRTSAVHATTTTLPQPRSAWGRIAWGRLFALAATVCLWVGIIAGVRAIL
jgi:hypothetical protein